MRGRSTASSPVLWGVVLCGLLAAGNSLPAQTPPTPGLLTQDQNQLPEPPLAEEPPKNGSDQETTPVPVVPPPPPPKTETAPVISEPAPTSGRVIGTPCPVDPPVPVVVLRVRVAACSPEGQQLKYKICVENVSVAPAHHVLVRDVLPKNARYVGADPKPQQNKDELLWALGTLPPCCCRTIELIVEPTNDQDIKNCARVSFEHGQCVVTRLARSTPTAGVPGPGQLGPFGQPGTPQPPKKGDGKEKEPPVGDGKEKPDKDKLEPVPAGAIKLEVSGPRQHPVGVPITYKLTLKNVGPTPVRNALVHNDLPEKTKFISANRGGISLANRVAWQIGTLQPNQSETVEVTYEAFQAGKICVQPVATADPNLRVEAKFCTVFRGDTALSTFMEQDIDPIAAGETSKFEIRIRNTGNKPASNISVTGFAPPELEIYRANGPVDHNRKIDSDGGHILQFDTLKSLAGGKEAVFEIYVRARRVQDLEIVVFKMLMNADEFKGPPVREDEPTTIIPEEGPNGTGLEAFLRWKRILRRKNAHQVISGSVK